MLYTLLYLLFGFLGNCDSASSSLVQTCSASVRGLHYFANTEPRCQFNQLKRVQEKMVKEVRHYQFNWTNRTEMIERVHHCRFNWTNRKKMVEKARERITHRQKLFLRFKVPVYYPNASLSWKQAANEFETWVWVAATHEYMLFFPHNFNVLSLGTMGIITNNFWEPGGEGEIAGHCDRTCAEFTTKIPRCVLTWKDIQSSCLMLLVRKPNGTMSACNLTTISLMSYSIQMLLCRIYFTTGDSCVSFFPEGPISGWACPTTISFTTTVSTGTAY